MEASGNGCGRGPCLVPLVSYTEDQPCQEEAIEDGDTVAMIPGGPVQRRPEQEAPEKAGEETGDRKQRIGCGPRSRHPDG